MTSHTPEFVRWTIPLACPLREFDGWQDPEQTERRLRPLRSYSEALAQGRIFEGICVAASVSNDPSTFAAAKGFRAAEVLEAYGGQEYVSGLCRECPANARLGLEREPLAGCFGWLEFSRLDQLHDDLEAVVERLGLQEALAAEFAITTPRWYGLWIEPSPLLSQLDVLSQLLGGLAEHGAHYRNRLCVFLSALKACRDGALQLHLALVPRGEYTATRWTLVSHCPRCKAPWAPGPRRCAACGHAGRPQASKRRNVRGERPYWRLAGFLGADNVEPFLSRYFAQRQAGES